MGTFRSLVRRATMALNAPFVGLMGSLDEWRAHRERTAKVGSAAEGLAHLTGAPAWEGEGAGARPVFVLAAGWRSGSTLLQRLILSSGSVFMWGEAYPHCDLVRRLAESARAFGGEHPRQERFEPTEKDVAALARDWIPTLSPRPEHLAKAHRTFFVELFQRPALAEGFHRWGFKEVRLTAEHAFYLRWLFPSASFVLLVRDPVASYASYRSVGTFYDRWPDRPILTARQFGEHWRERAAGFLERKDELDAHLVRFEDLVRGGEALERLEDYLKVTVDRSVLNVKKSGTANEKHRLSALDRFLVSWSVRPTAGELGYGG